MRAFWSDVTRRHDPRFFMMRGRQAPHEDAPARVDRFLEGARVAGLALEEAPPASREALTRVHTERYVTFLEDAWEAWQRLPAPGPEVIGNVQPRAQDAHYPGGIVGRAGWHLGDLACPVGPSTFRAARAAAGLALAAADAVSAGERAAYAMCRPPGHHASAEVAGGHCYINNIAVAAQHLVARGARVAILDIDVHHGNGTQAIFYSRADVLTVSVHGDPSGFYPWFNGYTVERGTGAGEGATHNLVLPFGADDAAWLRAIDEALDRISSHSPDVVAVSVGFDVHRDDPLGAFRVSTDAIGEAGRKIAAKAWPAVIAQEGGYMSPALALNVSAFLKPFATAAL